MSAAAHPTATHHLPFFITAPGQTDVRMVVMTIIVIGSGLGGGVFFLRLRTER